MRSKWGFAVLFLMCCFVGRGQTTMEMLEKGIVYTNEAETFQYRLNPWVRLRADYSSNNENFDPYVKSIRLDNKGYILSKNLFYRLHLALEEKARMIPKNAREKALNPIFDAYLQYTTNDGHRFTVGQFLVPGHLEHFQGIKPMQFNERSLVSGKFGQGRDLGLMYTSPWIAPKVRLYLGVFSGEGRSFTQNFSGGNLLYMTRLELMPLAKMVKRDFSLPSDIYHSENAKLLLGLAYNYNKNASRSKGIGGPILSSPVDTPVFADISTYSLDGVLKWQGYSFFSQLLYRQVTAEEDLFNNGYGFHTQLGYTIWDNWETALRYAYTLEKGSNGDFTSQGINAVVRKFLLGYRSAISFDVGYAFNDQYKGWTGLLQLDLGL